ncbi:MAG: UTP--glucose-1-phosphate uridylyltransferase GalU [Thermoleophilia bacterium]
MKAVIPAAGLGTRFLPATKAQPKEMLPVVDKPTIQYVVEEAVASGIDDILIVTGRGKRAIEDHFDKTLELEQLLERGNNDALLAEVRRVADMAHIHYIRQKHQLGLGDAIYCARQYVGRQPFAVLLGDTITMCETPCTKELVANYKKYGASVIAVERVPDEKVSNYGIVDVEKIDSDGIFKIKSLIEKPAKDEAPSNLAIFGRYVLTPEIFTALEQTEPGKNGEIQLTDALSLLLEKQDIYAYEVTGRRYDIGNKLDWLKANIELALERQDLGKPLEEYLKSKCNN